MQDYEDTSSIKKSTIKFYKCPLLTPERNSMYSENANISGFSTFINSYLKKTINDFQYVKNDLNITIKINQNQSEIETIDLNLPYNYVSIKNDDSQLTYYYFIMNVKWISLHCVAYELSIDSIATFWNYIEFSNKTLIHRQHKDRFNVPATLSIGDSLIRNVDNISEGAIPLKIKESVNEIIDADKPISGNRPNLTNLWYLVYRTVNDASIVENNPVHCFLCADEDLPILTTGGTTSINVSGLNTAKSYIFLDVGNRNQTITTNVDGHIQIKSFGVDDLGILGMRYKKVFQLLYVNNKWQISLFGYSDSSGEHYRDKNTFETFDGDTTNTITLSQQFNTYFISSNIQTTTNYDDFIEICKREATIVRTHQQLLLSINSFDKTDNRLVKIIECPYCPLDDIYYNSLTGYWHFPNYLHFQADQTLELTNINKEFFASIYSLAIPNMSLTMNANYVNPQSSRYDIMESKIYHSDFSSLKFVYDSFSMDFARERFDIGSSNETPLFRIIYKQSNAISSTLFFAIQMREGQIYKNIADFEQFILVNRNNELPIYTSDYINYLKNGYNYDKKAKERQQTTSAVATAASLIGSVVSFAAGGPVGVAAGVALASSSVVSLVNAANNSIQAEENLQQKLNSYKMQSASVSNNDDLDLMRYYSNNTIRMIQYTPSQSVKKSLFDLFYYTGYLCEYMGIPNIYSRNNFNFISCSPILTLNKSSEIIKKYLDDIKQRFEAGLTIYHNTNDFGQIKNNVEKSITNALQ